MATVGGFADFVGASQGIGEIEKWISERTIPNGVRYLAIALSAAAIFAIGKHGIYQIRRNAKNIDVIDGTEAPQRIRRGSINDSKINYQNLLNYHFRMALSELEIHELSKTEDYDQTPEDYNIETLVNRWYSYKQGNWVGLRKNEIDPRENKVCCGIDIWPIEKSQYLKIQSGEFGEDIHLEHSIKRTALSPGPYSYWYLGSISLDILTRKSKLKRDVLMALIGSFVDQILSSKVIDYPCHIIALAWSENGRNLLSKFEFTLLSNEHKHGHVYEISFKNEIELRDFSAPYLVLQQHLRKP